MGGGGGGALKYFIDFCYTWSTGNSNTVIDLMSVLEVT